MADDAASYGSRGGLVNRRGGARTSQESTPANFFEPGQPIGYLSARGTPYEKKYFTKKLGFCCLFLAPPIAIVTAVITLVPVLWAIANHALHTSQMHIYASNITAPGNSSFPLTIEGQVKKTGIFPAHLYFRQDVDVYWMSPPESEGGMRELHLGSIKLGQIGAAAGHARIKQATTFNIVDEEGFGEFSEYLITKEEFTWQLRCAEVHAEAFSFFPTYKSFNFVKNVVIKGLNGFEDVKIINLQLPSDDPAGGITVQTITQLVNPSPFGVQVGNLAMDLFYKGMYLGPVTTQNLNLTAGVNIVSLNGRLVPHADNATELALLGELFTNYINGDASPVTARGVSTSQADGSNIAWLSRGIKALEVNIPFQAPEPIDPIRAIGIDYLSLIYSEDRPWNPDVFSNDLTGIFALPFGFSLNITRLAATLMLEYQGAPVGTIEGPYAESATNITTLSTGETSGTISISLPQSQLLLPNNTDAARQQLVRFQNAFTFGEEASFTTKGSARTLTDTPLGRVLLDGIRFKVKTGLKGLQGLVKYPTIINTVDVVGGTAEGVSLGLSLTVVNPSNLNLTVGDSIFEVVNGVPLGTTTLPNLNLKIGRNDVNATSMFDPNRDAKGIETLNRFVSGLDTTLNITGFSGSSNIESLAPTFAPLRLNATLPGLQTPLITSANLTVLPTTGITDDIANSIVGLANPFSAGLNIQRIQANASANGVRLATIDTSLNFPAPGKAVTGSPNVPLSVNLFPPDIFAVLRSFAIQAGLNPAYIDGVVALGGFTLTATTPVSAPAAAKRDESFVFEDDSKLAHMLMSPRDNMGVFADEDNDSYSEEFEDGLSAKRALPLPSAGLAKRANLYTGFMLTDYVRQAFASAKADLEIVSDTLIGDYGTTLTFSQQNVPLVTDESLFLLLPVLAGPIVQKIVDGAVLNIDRVTITEARPTSFTANLQGSLTNSGPFDGSVSFPQGLTIFYEGRPLTQTAFPNITLTGDLGAAISVELQGEISDVPFFTEFLKTAIAAPSFLWNIRGEGIVVDALGISVPNITLNKDVQLTGLNGLKGQVIINSFDIPSNAPEGGISLTAVSTINNPAQVGVALSRFGVQISRNGTTVGPSAAAQPFTLQALAVTTVPLAGRILPQEGAGLAVLSEIFTNFVHNVNTPLIIEGDYAGPPDVVWLNEGIRSLRVEVSLPSQDFDVIRLISINQLSLFFTKPTEWAPLTDSRDTQANFFLPFALPIDIKTVEGPFIARYNGVDIATLNIPRSDAVTEVEARILHLMFNGIPFAVFNNGRSQFSQFVADTTAREQVTFNLHGTATSDAQTGAGLVTITDIPFDLNTNLLGLQNLNARPAVVSDLDVKRGYPDRLEITVMVALFNPSDLTIGTGDVKFQVRFQDRPIGEAVITDLTLVPGENRVPTLINYMPRGAENVRAGQTLLENYVSNITSASVVQGTRDTTNIASLQQALAGITLNTDIPGLGKLIVQQANLIVPRDIAQNGGIAQTSVVIANPFTASISILQLYAQANYEDITVGTIDTRLNPPIFAPGRSTTQSQNIPIKLDLNPKTLIRFILAAARNTGTDLGPFPPFLQRVLDLQNTETSINPVPDDSQPSCQGGFDLRAATLQALRGLTTTIPIRSVQKIDEYQTNLNFVQSPVPTVTDESVLYLLGPAGAPLIQLIVDESVLRVDIANATSITNLGFMTTLAGALLADTPAAAQIEFNEPLTIEWQGSIIAEISLPPLCVQPPSGIPNLRTSGQLTIRNQRRFTDFAIYLLANPSFEWTLASDDVTVRSLGIAYQKVKLSKKIKLDAFNGLPGVTISKFDAPSDAPGRINIETVTQIPSQASLGVELGQASFDLFFRGTNLGEASSRDLFLAAKTTTETLLRGFLRRQSGQGLENVGILFSQYLAGQNTTLQVRGKDVITPASGGQPVKWLSDAFKTLTLNVVLPGQIFKIIYGITLSDLTVEILNESNEGYTAIVSNNETLARFANPFGFGLGVSKAGVDSVIQYEGDAARLNLSPRTPIRAGVSRGPDDIQDLVLNFRKEDLVAIDRGAYQRFLARTTNFPEVDFVLKGTTSVVSITEIGNVPITGIPFNVSSNLDGINSFNKKADVANVVVSDATNDYISIKLDATVENPSDITLYTNNVRLPITKDGVEVGRAYISPLTLFPGSNVLKTDFRYAPLDRNSAVAQGVVTSYLQPPEGQENGVQRVALKIQGRLGANPTLSNYDALELALAGTEADTELVGIGSRIVQRVDNYITFETLIQSFTTPKDTTIEASLILTNDLPVQVEVLALKSDVYDFLRPQAGLQASFDYTFKTPFVTPPAPRTGAGPRGDAAYKNNERITGIRLANGLLGALPLVGHTLNVNNIIVARVRGESGAYTLPSLKYDQVNVPADYFLELVPGLPIKLNGIGDLLTGLNGLTGDLLFSLLDAIGKLSTGQIPNTILGQAPVAKTICNLEDRVRVSPVLDPLGLLNFGVDKLEELGCGTQLRRIAASSSASASSSSASASAASVAANPVQQATSALGGIAGTLGLTPGSTPATSTPAATSTA